MKRDARGVVARLFPAIALLAALGSTHAARGDLILTNASFEAGLTGWTVANSLGSDGSFFSQSGTLSPVNGDTVAAPTDGTKAAMSDGLGPGSHALYQDFVVPSTLRPFDSVLQFDLFIGNRASFFATPSPPSSDFGINAFNQQVRVDLLKASADPFSVGSTDVVQNLFQSKPGDPLVSGYRTFGVNIRNSLLANTGQALRLRFLEVDNVGPLQMGVDSVAFQAIPEPSQLVMVGLGSSLWLVFGLFRARRKMAAR
jgi:hypothetical protein